MTYDGQGDSPEGSWKGEAVYFEVNIGSSHITYTMLSKK